MGRTLPIAVVAVAVLFLSEPTGSVEDLRGQQAPDFTLKSVQGKKVSLDDFKAGLQMSLHSLKKFKVLTGPERLTKLDNSSKIIRLECSDTDSICFRSSSRPLADPCSWW